MHVTKPWLWKQNVSFVNTALRFSGTVFWVNSDVMPEREWIKNFKAMTEIHTCISLGPKSLASKLFSFASNRAVFSDTFCCTSSTALENRDFSSSLSARTLSNLTWRTSYSHLRTSYCFSRVDSCFVFAWNYNFIGMMLLNIFRDSFQNVAKSQ